MIYYDMCEFEDPMEDVFYGDLFEEVTDETLEDQSRWETFYSQVLKRKSDGSFWQASWKRGSTEYQESEPELTLVKVEPYEVTVTKYRVAKE